MKPFDLLGPLPAPGSTTVLEASAGTGKTFALAALVTRYVAEGVATLDEMLLITFSRAATRELRERVRAQLVEAVEAFGPAASPPGNELIAHLLDGDPEDVSRRGRRLRHALANFDAATIATTHQFCQIVLKSLGVAGDNDPDVQLVESLDDVVTEIVDDIYLAHFGQQKDAPPLTHDDALDLARAAVDNPGTAIRPVDAPDGSEAAIRVDFVRRVLDELEPRKRRLRIQGYDDLLSRLADALEPEDAPARMRMRGRWRIVMVDEFQDTDPIQWQVIERAFAGACTLVLIGDPKQAIYAFRGGDIATYLAAAHTAGERRTLAINWRSDKVLVDAVHAVLTGAELGDPDIVVGEVAAHHQTHRLAGAPHNDPFRLRVVGRDRFGKKDDETIPIADLRTHIAKDLAADVAQLLSKGATFDGRRLTASDIAVIVENRWDAAPCGDALKSTGISAVYSGDADVFDSEAAADWLCLIEAIEQTPPRPRWCARRPPPVLRGDRRHPGRRRRRTHRPDCGNPAGLGRPCPAIRRGRGVRVRQSRRDGQAGAGDARWCAADDRPRASGRPAAGGGTPRRRFVARVGGAPTRPTCRPKMLGRNVTGAWTVRRPRSRS